MENILLNRRSGCPEKVNGGKSASQAIASIGEGSVIFTPESICQPNNPTLIAIKQGCKPPYL